MAKTLNILFLAAAKRLSLFERFQAACRLEGVDCRLFSYETSTQVPVAQVASVIEGKSWDDPALAADVREIVAKNQIHIIVPCVNRAVWLLSQWAADLERMGCFVVTSDEEVCRIFDSKRLTEEWFLRNGVQTPKWSPNSPLPWLLKPTFGAAARGQIHLNSREEFEKIRASVNLDDYVLQPFISGVEYTVDSYVSRACEVLGCVPRLRLAVADGEVVRSRTEEVPGLVERCKFILSHARFRGPITLQAIMADSQFWFLEINPRFGGGVILSIEAGADYPRLCVREALGRPVSAVEWRKGILMTRAYREMFFKEDQA
jgi:carbamoyl-phosphate synthase large subunit